MNEGKQKSFQDLFLEHDGRLIDKWSGYFNVYDRHFGRYRNQPVKVLEIGVYHGGSLQLWKEFFGSVATIVGVDIDARCADYAEENVTIEIGDQSSPSFWQAFFQKHGDFDVIIDDGSHVNQHQIITFLQAWPHLKDGGTFLVEDLCCAYWSEFAGGYRSRGSFIEFAKDRVDDLHAFWSKDHNSFRPNQFTYELGAMAFYDAMAVFEKSIRTQGMARMAVGNPSRTLSDDEFKVVEAAKGNAAGLMSRG